MTALLPIPELANNEIETAIADFRNEIFEAIANDGPFAEHIDNILKRIYASGYSNGLVTSTLKNVLNNDIPLCG